MKYGFEREFFVLKAGKPVLVAKEQPRHPTLGSLGYDGCGYLAETRSEPHSDPFSAAHLLLAADDKAHVIATHAKMKLVLAANRKLDTAFLREVKRMGFGAKGKMMADRYRLRGNLYGHDFLNDDLNISHAGLHVHFSDQAEMTTYDTYQRDPARRVQKTLYIRTQLDIPKIVRLLDKAFADEIKRAGRLPGFYEIKGHGFEYRSLPATVDVLRVARVLIDAKLDR